MKHNVFGVVLCLTLLETSLGSCPPKHLPLRGSGSFSVAPFRNKMRCSWTLRALRGQKVIVTFTAFSTEKCCDHVKIRDGSSSGPIVAIFSGSDLPPDVVSCGNALHVSFHSDSDVLSTGFSATFKSQDYIASPGFPGYYSNGERRSWLMCGLQSRPLCLHFSSFLTELNYDWVKIGSKNGSLIGQFSGLTAPSNITSTTHLVMNFTSDSSTVRFGFRAELCSNLCPAIAAPTNGFLSSSHRHLGRVVRIICPPGYTVVGPSEVSCMPGGTWSHTPQSDCSRIHCSSPPTVANGLFFGRRYYAGGEVRLVCNEGYYVAGGKNTFRCSSAGVWSDRTRMVCPPVACGIPTAPRNGSVNGDSHYLNDVVTFSCNVGYNLEGATLATCLPTGLWSHSSPTCTVLEFQTTLSPEVQRLLLAVQDTLLDSLATFTEEAQPPAGSALKSGHPTDSVIALDLIFALDTSGSIGEDNFEFVKTFVKSIAKPLVMNTKATHIAALAFGSEVYVISEFTSSKSRFLRDLAGFKYKGGATNTGGALRKAKEMFKASPRGTKRLKRLLILVTDGRSNSQQIRPKVVTKALAAISVERFTFGIGSINWEELDIIASPPNKTHVFIAKNFVVFRQFAEMLRPKPVSHTCGIAGAPGFHSRVVRGDISSYGAWPWLASIFVEHPTRGFEFICGGSLINEQWIVTAAHCVYVYQWDKSTIQVKLGDYSRHVKDQYEQTFNVSDVKVGDPPERRYFPGRVKNDIAFIKLHQPVIYNNYVRPICLQQQPRFSNPNVTLPNETATVVGWGIYAYRRDTPLKSAVPREATVSFHQNSHCEGSDNSPRLTRDMVCARGIDTNVCYGDSGGPLMCQLSEDNRFTLCGVVSFGSNTQCLRNGFGVYTKTTNYIDTINVIATS